MFSRRRRNQPRRSCSAAAPDAASSGPRAPSAVMNRSSQSRATGMRDDSSVSRSSSVEMEVRVERADQPAGQALLDALEDAARNLGYERIRLDTGVHQPEGLALYRSAAYAEIPRYNDNAYAGYWFEKELGG